MLILIIGTILLETVYLDQELGVWCYCLDTVGEGGLALGEASSTLKTKQNNGLFSWDRA